MVLREVKNSYFIHFRTDHVLSRAASKLSEKFRALDQARIVSGRFPGENGLPYKKEAFNGVFLPTELEKADQAFQEIGLGPGHTFVDLGGGDARIAFLAAMYGAKSVSIEGDKEIHRLAMENQALLGKEKAFDRIKKVGLVRGDFFRQDLSSFNTVFVYYPDSGDVIDFSDRLDFKLKSQLQAGSRHLWNSYRSRTCHVTEFC